MMWDDIKMILEIVGIIIAIGFIIGIIIYPEGFVPERKIGEFICKQHGYSEFKKMHLEGTFLPNIKSIECLKDNETIKIGER